jgi:hypothetical protein
VDDVPGDAHVLAVPAAAREPDLVVALTQLRLAFLAAAAAVAGDDPLADDARTDREIVDTVADLGDRPAPFVARYEREADPLRVDVTVEHLEIGPADPAA